jgi:hypothetical protein
VREYYVGHDLPTLPFLQLPHSETIHHASSLGNNPPHRTARQHPPSSRCVAQLYLNMCQTMSKYLQEAPGKGSYLTSSPIVAPNWAIAYNVRLTLVLLYRLVFVGSSQQWSTDVRPQRPAPVDAPSRTGCSLDMGSMVGGLRSTVVVVPSSGCVSRVRQVLQVELRRSHAPGTSEDAAYHPNTHLAGSIRIRANGLARRQT